MNVLVLESEPGLLRKLTVAVEKNIPASFVQQASTADSLILAFAQAPARVVLIDEDSSQMSVALLIDRLRKLPGGSEAEVLVLARDGSHVRNAVGARVHRRTAREGLTTSCRCANGSSAG